MVCSASPCLLFCHEPLKSTPFPSILFSVCKALYILVFHCLLRSLSYFFSFFFSINFFFFLICHHLQYNTFPFRISFILLIFTPFTYSSPDPSFLLLLVKTVFLPPSWGKKWEGWVDFFAMETHECSNPYFETLQRRACTSLSTLSKFATAVNGSLTNA